MHWFKVWGLQGVQGFGGWRAKGLSGLGLPR